MGWWWWWWWWWGGGVGGLGKGEGFVTQPNQDLTKPV